MTQTEVIVSLKVVLFSENDVYCAHTWSYNVPITPVHVKQQMGSACRSPSGICHHFKQLAPSHWTHLCKHRATAAKHRCWRTVNTTPRGTMCHSQATRTLLFVLSSSKRKMDQFFHLQNFLSRERISKRESLSGGSSSMPSATPPCVILQHLSAFPWNLSPAVTAQLVCTNTWQCCLVRTTS